MKVGSQVATSEELVEALEPPSRGPIHRCAAVALEERGQLNLDKVEGSLNRARAWTGAWRIVGGAPGFPDASVYQLDGDASHGLIYLLRADDNLVLFLNQHRQPLPRERPQLRATGGYTQTLSEQ
jgi:hypothetical protein